MSVSSELSPSRLGALLRISSALTRSLEMSEVLQVAIDGAVELLHLDTGAIYRLAGETLALGATTPPLPAGFPDEYRIAPLSDHPHIANCLASGATCVLADVRSAELAPAERGVCEARGLRTLCYVPLLMEAEPVGVFLVGTTGRTRALSAEDATLCRTLAQLVALAMANARLFESVRAARAEIERAYDATLRGWSAALEMRDADTLGHAERTAELTLRLARSLGVPETELAHAYRGALLHDIGKMTVPDAILRKPGPLDAGEWELMRRHPEDAQRMLAAIDYLQPALVIPLCHHERWDGAGYPRSLAGEEIPLLARIFAVIDVYAALTSDRPYRPAWSHADAIEHIRQGAGSQFDPGVVGAFLAEIARVDPGAA